MTTQTKAATGAGNTLPRASVKAAVSRWPMCGGGTAYSVRFLKSDKPTHPLHNGHVYCTTILSDFRGKHREFFEVVDAIDPRKHWEMEAGWDKYEAYKRLEKIANRLAVRIAKRAFPELARAKQLPILWASYTLPERQEKWIDVKMQLPA